MDERMMGPSYGTAVPAALSTDRRAFIRKTYLSFFFSILLASAAAYATLASGLWLPVAENWIIFGLLLMGGAFALSFVLRRSSTAGVLLGAAFVAFTGVVITPALIIGQAQAPGTPLAAFLLASGTFAALTAHVFISKRDYSFMGRFLFVALIAVILAVLINLFLGIPILGLILSSIIVLLMVGFILYDTSNIVHHYAVDQWLPASFAIYIDFFNLFWALLSILGFSRDD